MADEIAPLSPTVASIFSEFLKKLEAEKILGVQAIEALRNILDEQKLDPESLRKVLFMPTEPEQ
jgi:hypothetical protein